MKRLSEYRGEDALDILAELIEPATEIMRDKEMVVFFRAKQMAKAVKVALRKHKQAVLNILYVLDGNGNPDEDELNKSGMTLDEYAKTVTVFTLPQKLLDIFNDPDLLNLFSSQGQKTETPSSGSATENTEAAGK